MTKPRTDPVLSLEPSRARDELLKTNPWWATRRGHRWMVSPYWAVRDPGTITPKQNQRMDANLSRALAFKDGFDPDGMLRRVVTDASYGDRVLLQRAKFGGLPAFVRNEHWPEWRPVYTGPGGLDIVGCDDIFACAIEALHPGHWESRRGAYLPRMLRIDRAGRFAAVLMPVRISNQGVL